MWVESLLGRRHLLLKFRLLNNILLWISILHLHLRLRLLLYLLKVSLIRLLLYMCMLWGNRLFWKISIEPGILMRLPGRGRRLRVIRIKTGLHLLLLGRIRRLLRKVRMEANGSLSLGRGWLRLMLHWFRLRGRLSKVRLEGSLLISTTILWTEISLKSWCRGSALSECIPCRIYVLISDRYLYWYRCRSSSRGTIPSTEQICRRSWSSIDILWWNLCSRTGRLHAHLCILILILSHDSSRPISTRYPSCINVFPPEPYAQQLSIYRIGGSIWSSQSFDCRVIVS